MRFSDGEGRPVGRWKGSLLLILLIFLVSSAQGAPLVMGVLGGENALSTSEAWNGLCASIREMSCIDLRYQVFEEHSSLLRALKERRIDFALIDPAWFVKEKDWVRPLVGTEILGSSTYRVMLIVPRNSIYYKTSLLSLHTTGAGARALAQTPFSRFTPDTGDEYLYRILAEWIRKVEAVYGPPE